MSNDLSKDLGISTEQVINEKNLPFREAVPKKPIKIFFHYVSEDEEVVDMLKKYLTPATRMGNLQFLYPLCELRGETVQRGLEEGAIMLSIILASYLADDEIYEERKDFVEDLDLDTGLLIFKDDDTYEGYKPGKKNYVGGYRSGMMLGYDKKEEEI